MPTERPSNSSHSPRIELVWPSDEYLASYVSALEQGWSPDTSRAEAAHEQLARIAEDPATFLAQQVDREGNGPAVALPDGSTVPRLPGYHKWIWDGEFCGGIALRWQPGTEELPPYCLGHIGYSVVPGKGRRGYASRALALMLPEARREGLSYVEITTDVDNVASQRVIVSNGGRLVERFQKLASHGGTHALRYRIDLTRDPTTTGTRPR